MPVDIWSVGTIIPEMVTGQPLFPGDSEIDAIYKIFRHLGTPTDDVWPGVTKLPHFQAAFPAWKPRPLHEVVPTLTALDSDLLSHVPRWHKLPPGRCHGVSLRRAWGARLAWRQPEA